MTPTTVRYYEETGTKMKRRIIETYDQKKNETAERMESKENPVYMAVIGARIGTGIMEGREEGRIDLQISISDRPFPSDASREISEVLNNDYVRYSLYLPLTNLSVLDDALYALRRRQTYVS